MASDRERLEGERLINEQFAPKTGGPIHVSWEGMKGTACGSFDAKTGTLDHAECTKPKEYARAVLGELRPQMEFCLRGEHVALAYVTVRTGVGVRDWEVEHGVDRVPTQEFALCRHCRCLYVARD